MPPFSYTENIQDHNGPNAGFRHARTDAEIITAAPATNPKSTYVVSDLSSQVEHNPHAKSISKRLRKAIHFDVQNQIKVVVAQTEMELVLEVSPNYSPWYDTAQHITCLFESDCTLWGNYFCILAV